jgi:hypothetical protein
MGVGKVLGFFGGALLSLLILVATAVFAWLAYRRRREAGFLWLLIAAAAQLVGAVIGRIAFSPFTIVEYPIKDWLTYGSFYISGVAPLIGLIGWILLARRKNA